jgi:REP element-mobilizing transposase RayT
MESYRFFDDDAVYFVTFTIVRWLPMFVSEASCRIVTDSLDYCRQDKDLCTNAFVIMPTHMHAILFDSGFDGYRLRRAVADLRKFTGRALTEFCVRNMPQCFSETLHAAASGDRERMFWQGSRHPEVIESEPFWRTKLDYVHGNPCRKGLVTRAEHWRFSSAAFWLSDGNAACDVVLSELVW